MKITFRLSTLDDSLTLLEVTEDYTKKRINHLAKVLRSVANAGMPIKLVISIHY